MCKCRKKGWRVHWVRYPSGMSYAICLVCYCMRGRYDTWEKPKAERK